jgi:hypothetical protein
VVPLSSGRRGASDGEGISKRETSDGEKSEGKVTTTT